MKIQENHEWNLYGIAYGIAERTLFEVDKGYLCDDSYRKRLNEKILSEEIEEETEYDRYRKLLNKQIQKEL